MAGFMDMLNQGLGNVTSSPLGQLSLQMMMNSGYQPGNPGGGQRMGQALAGMGQMQAQQQQLQYQGALRQQQQQELALRSAAMKREEDQRQTLMQLAQDPEFLKANPQARAVLGATGDMGLAGTMSKLNPMQKPPTMPGVFDKYNPDNTVQQQIWNPQTGSYDSGPAYTKPDQMRANAYVDKTNQDMQYKPTEVANQTTSAETAKQNAETQRGEAVRKMNAAALKNRVSTEQLTQGYRGTVTQVDDAIKQIDELLAPDSGLEGNYGIRGWIKNAPGMDAANARAKLDRLKATAAFTEIAKLKGRGISLTPMSDPDRVAIQNSAINLDQMMDAGAARKELGRYRESLMRTKDEASQNYNEMVGAYAPQGQSPAQQQPTRINDDAGYNALPSGATFIAPDGSMRRKP